MKEKSIMFFGWLFWPKVGGAETILLNQARELIGRGYKVIVLTSVLENGVEDEETLFGIRVFRRKYVDSREPQNGEYIKKDLAEILRQVNPSIFHFHNGSYPSGSKDKSIGVKTMLSIFDTVKKFGVPIVEHAHNAQLKDSEVTKPLRELPWDCLIAVSNFVRLEWQKLGTKAKSIKVVYNGIEVDKFSKALANIKISKFGEGEKVVMFSPARLFSLTTGELNKQKNLKLVFDALGILVEKGVNNFVLVSIFNEVYNMEASKAAKEKIGEIIETKKLNGKINFIPVIEPDDMPGYYAGADIVCVPALHETFGLMYLEAMAAGKVVIASNTGGPREYIENGKNGFFVDPDDPDELALVLKQLIENEELRKKIGEQAKIDAKKYSVKQMVDGIEKVYQELGVIK